MLQQPEAIFIYLFIYSPLQFSHVAPKVTNHQPQENLVKSGYKTNRKGKKI
jgi:hypothetical protein